MTPVTVQSCLLIGLNRARLQAVTTEIPLQTPTPPPGGTGTHSGIRSCRQESSNLEWSTETLGSETGGCRNAKLWQLEIIAWSRPSLKIFDPSGGQLGSGVAASNETAGSGRQSILLTRLNLAFAQLRA